MIKLFESNEREFKTNGLGGLHDASSCVVKEELNGGYELEMEYPITGIHYSELKLRRIILAKPNKYDRTQPFRIYSISKPINGKVTVNAEHISYDLSGITVFPAAPYYVTSVDEAMSYLMSNSVTENPFNLISLMSKTGDMSTRLPRTVRSMLGTDDNSILAVYGGEYSYDRFNITLSEKRGTNRGVIIRYGKNLTDLKQEENCANVYTSVCPFYYVESDGFQYLDERVYNVDGTFDYVRTLPLDLTSEFEEMPTQQQLRDKAKEYIEKNKIGIPKVSLTVSFVSQYQDTDLAMLEDVRVGDTVLVKFLKLGVDSESECISISYDPISNKYITIELGEPVGSISDTISDTVKDQNGIKDSLTETNNNLDRVTVDVQKNSDSIVAEVSRATAAEGNLSSRLSITDSAITAEVSRATAAEGNLSARISVTASEVSSKVTKGDVVSEINQTSDTIRLTSNRLVIETANFKLDGSGNMTAVSALLDKSYITNGLYYRLGSDNWALITVPSQGRLHIANSVTHTQVMGSFGCGNAEMGTVAVTDNITVGGKSVLKQGDSVSYATSAGSTSYASESGRVSTGYLTMSSGTIQADSGSLWIGQNTVRANTIEQTSSARYKKEIDDYTGNALDIISESRIREYRYLDEPDQEQIDEYKATYKAYDYKKHIGVVVEEVDKSIVTQCGNGLDMGAMLAIAWKAIQELKVEVDILKNK